MSRILTRPMFRLGGSTSGITSGLDTPKLKASRQNYNRGRVVNPGGYQGDPAYKDRLRNRVTAARDVLNEFTPQRGRGMPGSLSSFLMNFGVNLGSQTPTGNLISTAFTAAKQPLQQFQAARASDLESEKRLNQAILGDAMETMSEEQQAKDEGGSYDIGAAAKVARLRDTLYQKQLDLQRRQTELEDKETLTEEEERELENIIESGLPAVQGNIADLDDAKSFLEKLDIAPEGIQESFADMVDDFVKDGMEFGEAFKKAQAIFEPLLGKKAGGRVGKQLGGEVSFQEDVEVERPVGGRTQSAGIYNLDYTTLRSRLPQEIGDDIVKLLAESEEALTEFANIRTQEDVNQFNTQFSVNLVLPQEV